jgi:hypothetical protein
MLDDYHFQSVAEELVSGRVIPFLGAGANLTDRAGVAWSLSSPFLPNGAELAEHLSRRGNYPRREDRDLGRVSQFVEVEVAEGRFYRFLREVFYRSYEPTSLHRLIARIGRHLHEEGRAQLIVATTNYDDLVEQAFDGEGLEHDVVWYDARRLSASRGRFMHSAPHQEPVPVLFANDYRGLPLALERPVILKLHGCFNRAGSSDDATGDSYVVTEDGYIDYLTGADIADLLPIAVWQQLTRRSFLFLGYSLSDWNMRVVLRRIWGAHRLEEKSWAVLLEPRRPDGSCDVDASRIERALWRTRDNVELVYCDLARYVREIELRMHLAGHPMSSS